jgi:hypothetical protein
MHVYVPEDCEKLTDSELEIDPDKWGKRTCVMRWRLPRSDLVSMSPQTDASLCTVHLPTFLQFASIWNFHQRKNLSETAPLHLTTCSPCIWCCLGKKSRTCPTLLGQTASDPWATHTALSTYSHDHSHPLTFSTFCCYSFLKCILFHLYLTR